jgi:hypothetical protein
MIDFQSLKKNKNKKIKKLRDFKQTEIQRPEKYKRERGN